MRDDYRALVHVAWAVTTVVVVLGTVAILCSLALRETQYYVEHGYTRAVLPGSQGVQFKPDSTRGPR